MKRTRLSPPRSINEQQARQSGRSGRGCLSSVLFFMGWFFLLPSLALAAIGIGPMTGPSGEGVTIGVLLFGAGLLGGLIGVLLLLAAMSTDRSHEAATKAARTPERRKPSPPSGLCTACGLASSRRYCDACASALAVEEYENPAHTGPGA